jgi:ubiquinone biosynthesis protein Coq4
MEKTRTIDLPYRPRAVRAIREFETEPHRERRNFAALFFQVADDFDDVELLWDMAANSEYGEQSVASHGLLEHACYSPDMAQIIRERPQFVANISDLCNLPERTLGGSYGRYMQAYSLDSKFFPIVPGNSDLVWYINWLRSIHDVMHLIAGYGPEFDDELGFQAFYCANARAQMGATYVSAGLLHASQKRPQTFGKLLHVVSDAFERGTAAKLLAAVRWHECWNHDLDELRSRLGVRGRQNIDSVGHSTTGPALPDGQAKLTQTCRH